MKNKLAVIIILLLGVNPVQPGSQIIMFPADSSRFVISDRIDSVFVFDHNLGVTAMGKDLSRLLYRDFSISGDSIPSTLKINHPAGAIMYSSEPAFPEIPIIIGRQNRKMPLDRLLRDYVLGLNEFKGHSEKGGIRIHVWQQKQQQIPCLIFTKNGQIIGNTDRNARGSMTKNFSLVNPQQIQKAIDDIAGVWIYPPEIGNNEITGEMLKLLQQGPLLVEYWDGLGWRIFEECFLSDKIKGRIDRAHIGYSVFPPVTETNYKAMISGGLVNLDGKMHLFDCLDSLQIPYQLLEGEKIIFPIQGKVQLHTAQTPEQKDEKVYQSALSVIDQSPPALLFLHYHGLDDLAHTFGPYGSRSIDHIRKLWQWHLELRRRWTGNLLIISDHGAHAILPDDNYIKKQGDQGTHGRFIFEDMAVPVLVDAGQGKAPTDFKLSSEQVQTIWQLLGTEMSLTSDSQTPKSGSLEIIFQGERKSFNAADDQVFGKEFQFNYTKKGVAVSGKFRGAELEALLDQFKISGVRNIVAHSLDGHQVIFSQEDFKDNVLVIGLDSAEKQFTLYPLKDRFPNRIVKQLQKIEIE